MAYNKYSRIIKMKLLKKTKLKEHYKRYDLEIEGTHTFVAEGVVVHNTNCRVGFVQSDNYDMDGKYIYVAGSHRVRRKEPEEGKSSLYWLPYDLCPNLKKMMYELWEIHCADDAKHAKGIVVYGEIYGAGVQDMQYDCVEGKGFRVFDISIGGEYMGHKKYKLFKQYKIPCVPILYTGPYSAERVREFTDGDTTLGSQGKFKGREGVVITSATEETHPMIGRKILKSISADYLDRKGGTDGH